MVAGASAVDGSCAAAVVDFAASVVAAVVDLAAAVVDFAAEMCIRDRPEPERAV